MTLSELKTRARVYLEDQGAARLSDETIKITANSVILYLWYRIKKRNPDWAQKSASIATVNGTANYALPSDFGALTFIERTSDKYKLEKWEWPRVDAYTAKGDPQYYRIIKGYVVLEPIPDAIYNLTLWYEYIVPALSLDADIHSLPEFFDDIIVMRTAYTLGAKINFSEIESAMIDEMAGRQRNEVRGYWDLTEDY